LRQLGTELRDARLSAGVSQRRIAEVASLSQSTVSRVEQARAESLTLHDAVRLASALGLRASLKLYPEGSPVRDASQLRLTARFRPRLHPIWGWTTEMLVGTHGDLRAWDIYLSGPGTVGVDAETRLYDIQAVQRRCEAKARDSGVDRVVLLVARSRHNVRVLKEHREALRSTFPLDTRLVLAALGEGRLPDESGIVLL